MPTASTPAFNALQVTLRSMHFDRATTISMFGYVIGLAQRNADGDGQLYLSRGSFKARRDGRASTKDDVVRRWEGDGELIFSAALAGLDSVGLDLYFVRDNRRVRGFGDVLTSAFSGSNAAVKQAIDAISGAIGSSGAGAVVALAPMVFRGLGNVLRKAPDRIKIRAEGSMRIDTLRQFHEEPEFDGELQWGTGRSDKGYFVTDWDLVTMSDPTAEVVKPKLPKALAQKIAML